jgi:hypothetical protein
MTSDGEVQGTGDAQPVVCANGHPLTVGQRFCAECGQPAAVRETPFPPGPSSEPDKAPANRKHVGAAIIGIVVIALIAAGVVVGLDMSHGASTPDSKFINSLHAWLPSTKASNSTEIREGDRICSDLNGNAASEGPLYGKQPYGFNAIPEEEGTLDKAEIRDGYFITSNPDAIFVLSADLIGVSVLDLCPTFEPAVRYFNSRGDAPAGIDIPTKNKVPQSILAAGWSGGYGYSPPVRPPPSTTTTTLAVPLNQPFGSPPGQGSPWMQAPSDLVAEVKSLAAHDPYGGFSYPAGATFWLSKDPNNPQWSVIEVNAPEPGDSGGGSGLGVVELLNNSWTVVSAVTDQAPGCYGPQGQTLPAGTSDVPSNVMSDFSLSC